MVSSVNLMDPFRRLGSRVADMLTVSEAAASDDAYVVESNCPASRTTSKSKCMETC